MITGAHGVLRIRAGDYRVLYTIDEGRLVVLAPAPPDDHAAGVRGLLQFAPAARALDQAAPLRPCRIVWPTWIISGPAA
jgi:hypothetical protein